MKKFPRTAHTADTQIGRGNYYGQGEKNKVGRLVEGIGIPKISPKKLKVPPKKLG